MPCVTQNPLLLRGINTRSVALSLFVALAAVSGGLNAADYPTRAVRYVVAYAPGGINDIMARLVGNKLSESWGQPVVVENRPGAGGNLAAALVARTAPDGYTFMNISDAHTISQTLYTKLDYSLERDLTPVVALGISPIIMVVNASVPVKNVAELVTWSRKNRLIYASGGIGGLPHLSMEMFKTAAKIDADHVPMKSGGPAVQELLSGRVHVVANAMPELLPYTKDGKLRIIGVMTETRHPLIPDVPTFIEQGYPDFVMGNWTGIVAPTGTPKEIVNKIAEDVTKILRAPDMLKRLGEIGVQPMGGTPDDFAKRIRSDGIRFGKAVKESGARVD